MSCVQKLGKNIGGYFGETIDIQAVQDKIGSRGAATWMGARKSFLRPANSN